MDDERPDAKNGGVEEVAVIRSPARPVYPDELLLAAEDTQASLRTLEEMLKTVKTAPNSHSAPRVEPVHAWTDPAGFHAELSSADRTAT